MSSQANDPPPPEHHQGLDGNGTTVDCAWDFGASRQTALRFGGLDTTGQCSVAAACFGGVSA